MAAYFSAPGTHHERGVTRFASHFPGIDAYQLHNCSGHLIFQASLPSHIVSRELETYLQLILESLCPADRYTHGATCPADRHRLRVVPASA